MMHARSPSHLGVIACKSDKNWPLWGRFSLSTTQVLVLRGGAVTALLAPSGVNP